MRIEREEIIQLINAAQLKGHKATIRTVGKSDRQPATPEKLLDFISGVVNGEKWQQGELLLSERGCNLLLLNKVKSKILTIQLAK